MYDHTLFWRPSDVINLLDNVHIQPTVELAFFITLQVTQVASCNNNIYVLVNNLWAVGFII